MNTTAAFKDVFQDLHHMVAFLLGMPEKEICRTAIALIVRPGAIG
jgi:hypothetical protein